jgi:hypothetical protein
MGGAHHDVGGLSRKRHTQYVGQQPKGQQWGNPGNTRGDLHGRRQGRQGASAALTGERPEDRHSWRHTHTHTHKTRGARWLQSTEQARSSRITHEGRRARAPAVVLRQLELEPAAGVRGVLRPRRRRRSADWIYRRAYAQARATYAVTHALRSRRPRWS